MIKQNRGITLIVLVITIIVLLILAGVSLSLTLGDDGLIAQTQKAREEAEAKDEWEQVELAVVSARNASLNGANFYEKLKENIEREFGSANVTQGEEDEYVITLNNGNKYSIMGEEVAKIEMGLIDNVKIPQGFHHVTGNTREEGIVVADEKGNEYVWIPVTKDEAGTPTEPYIATNGELNGKVIQLLGNALDDTTKFKESVVKNGGYFLGRYEAGIVGGELAENPDGITPEENYTYWTGGTLVCQKNQQVWNWVTRNKARELCENIDTENNYTKLTSDLVNSYAWDTTIEFIKMCGIEDNSGNYDKQVGRSKDSGGPFTTGTAKLKSPEMIDKQCNIYDMAGNCSELSTETGSSVYFPCVIRGGQYNSDTTTIFSGAGTELNAFDTDSFRPILYWN